MKALITPGAGAAGIITAGHLLAFEELGLSFDFIAGTSSGCLNAGMFHQGGAQAVLESWLTIKNRDIYNLNPFTLTGGFRKGGGVADSKPMFQYLSKHLDKSKLGPQPFLITATNEVTRQPFQKFASELTQEELVTLCYASASIPALFPVVRYHSDLLCDGGITANAAIRESVSQGADTIYVLIPRKTRAKDPGDALARVGNIISTMMEQLIMREIKMVEAYNRIEGKRHIDMKVVSPTQYVDIGLADFDGLGDYYDRKLLIELHKQDALKQLSKYEN